MSASLSKPGPLHGLRALVVGGTSGIGQAAAVHLARGGAQHVAVVGRNADRGAGAQRLVEREGVEALYIRGDASQVDDVPQIVARAVDAMGGLDLMVNAVAPIGSMGPIDQMPAHDMVELLTGLVVPPMLMTREAIKVMRDSGGSIINIASDAAKVPTPGEAAVGGAMAAIAMFSRTAALEAKRYGIRINVLTPSLVLETGTAARIEELPFAAKIFSRIADKAALGVPSADDLAELIVFLSSPAASKITGQVISVNGGVSAG